MNSTVSAIRAITSLYAIQLLRPLLWIGIAIYAVVIVIVAWIALETSAWWWLLGVMPTVLFSVALALWIAVRIGAGRLAPKMDKKQKNAAKKVVDQVGRVAEQIGTPKFVLIFQVVKDVLFPPRSGQTLIGELTSIPGQLHRDFEALRKLF